MAKLALINKQKKREKLVAQYAKKREAIKAKMSVNATPDERMDAMKKLAKLPRNANPTRLHNRCSVTGRARGFSRLFGLCRQQLRTMASEGNCQAYVSPVGKIKTTLLWTMQQGLNKVHGAHVLCNEGVKDVIITPNRRYVDTHS